MFELLENNLLIPDLIKSEVLEQLEHYFSEAKLGTVESVE